MTPPLLASKGNAAALVILSDVLDPEELQSLIGLPADRTRRAGDAVAGGRARRRFSVWSIQEEHGPASAHEQLTRILERVSGVASRIGGIATDPRIHSISLWIWSSGEEVALDLTPGQVQEVARLGASLKVDVDDLSGKPSDEGGNGGPRIWPDRWDQPPATPS